MEFVTGFLTSCQLYRVTSGWSLCYNQMHILELFYHKPFLNSNPKGQSLHLCKTKCANTMPNTNFGRVSPFDVALVKKSTHNEGKHWVPVVISCWLMYSWVVWPNLFVLKYLIPRQNYELGVASPSPLLARYLHWIIIFRELCRVRVWSMLTLTVVWK